MIIVLELETHLCYEMKQSAPHSKVDTAVGFASGHLERMHLPRNEGYPTPHVPEHKYRQTG